MNKQKIEFSIKRAIMSALVNLSAHYGKMDKYIDALYDISDFDTIKELAKTKVQNSELGNKENLLEAINNSDDADDITRAIRHNTTNASTAKEIMSAVAKEIISGIDKADIIFADGVFCDELENISAFFGLGEAEKRIIALLYAWDESHEFERLCNDICRNSSRAKIFSFLGDAINADPRKVGAAIRGMREKNIIETTHDIFPALAREIREYIGEFDGAAVAEKFSRRLEIDKTFKLSTFPIAECDVKIIKKMLKSGEPRHILLYGDAGAGKSEFAKSLAKSLRKDVYVPKRENKDAALTHTNIKAAIYAARQSGSIALIDEADEFLETAPAGFLFFFGGKGNNERKGAVNELLDSPTGGVVWITNSISGIDVSTRRRFAYSLRFDGISDAQKEIIIKNSLAKSGLGGKFFPQMKTLSKRYGLSTAGIGLVIDKAAGISDTPAEAAQNIDRIAKAHYELLTNKKTAPAELKIDERFDPSILNIDFPLNSLSETLSNYKRAADGGKKAPLSFLFSGAAGTGKTQLGRYIAEALGRELIIKRMSEISDCYVGETEKNIRRMFLEAARNNAVLMIDEADSLFYDRRSARQSWEVSHTNEILAQMEVFSGVFICTTNLAENIDAAAMRRFNWKIKFSPPALDGRVKLYSKYFLGGRAPGNDVESALCAMDGLCPGDFKAVWQKTLFLSNKPDSLLLEALKSELAYKKDLPANTKRVGFC